MIDSEVSVSGDEKNKTHELLGETVNICPVTGYPFEIPRAREKILDILQEAIKNCQIVIFIDADLDNLKRLNDVLGHEGSNKGIRAVMEEKEKTLLGLDGVDTVLFYRPQAGGDEYKALLLLRSLEVDEEIIVRSLKNILKPDTKFQLEGKKTTPISCSFGITIKKCEGRENAGELLQEMESQAEEKLANEKLEKIAQKLNETIKVRSGLCLQEYITSVAAEWGSRRVGEKGLETILYAVLKKAGLENIPKIPQN